jgi:hypothetical protein
VPSTADLNLAIQTYQKLIANYSVTRDRLIAQIAIATEESSSDLENRLGANARTITSLGHAVDVAREQLKLRQDGAA